MPPSSYVLTPTARKNLREAKAWSRARWGNDLTTQYFHDLEKAALYIASHHQQSGRNEYRGAFSI